MIRLDCLFSESFGGTCTLRGYARYDEIVTLSYAHPGYQRPVDDTHVEEISNFITSGTNSFSPEVVLAYTAKYNYYKEGASSDVNPIADIRNGKGFASNVDGISFKKLRQINNGYLYEMSLPDKSNLPDEKKPFRRVDGNHRLQAVEQLIKNGQMKSTYLIPFCLIIFSDDSSLKDEKVVFHNINSKAVPIKSEQLLQSMLTKQNDGLGFSDKELTENFGTEYLLARKLIYERGMIIRKLNYIDWVKGNTMSTIVDLIEYVQSKDKSAIQTDAQTEAFMDSLNNALKHATILNATKLSIASGMLFLLVFLYYQIGTSALDPEHKKEDYKDRLVAWASKYNITDAQIDREENATVNADCIQDIFNKYMQSTHHTIFMSRCFASEYDETENSIRRAIDQINKEKRTSISLIRVDQHDEGSTGQISDRILQSIDDAGLIIADLSSGRPNIPHEIGYAMGLKKNLILVHNGSNSQADEHTPSNIKMYEQIRFNGNYTEFEKNIKEHLIAYYKL